MKMIARLVSIIAALVIGYFVTLHIRAAMWENDVGKRASVLIADIANPWSTKNILNHASIALKAIPYEDIERRSEVATQLLGSVIKVSTSPECNITQGIDTFSRKEFIYASCIMRVEFEKQTSNFFIRMVNQENQWLVDDFYIK